MKGKEIRKLRGKMTGPQFCKEIGLQHPSTLSRWETNKNAPSPLWEEKLQAYKAGKGKK